MSVGTSTDLEVAVLELRSAATMLGIAVADEMPEGEILDRIRRTNRAHRRVLKVGGKR